MPHFTYRVFSSTLHDRALLDRLLGDYFDALEAIGGRQADEAATPRLAFVATGGTERLILDWWQGLSPSRRRDPVFMIAHPGHNSLPASLETLARLHQLGARGKILYLRGHDDRVGIERVMDAVNALDVRATLQDTRIGLAGKPSDWLIASMPTPETVRDVWGPTLLDVSLDVVYEDFRAAAEATTEYYAKDLESHASSIAEPSKEQIEDASRLAVALRDVVEEQNLQAIAVRCFDLLEDISTSGCFALSELNDENTVAGCEGDAVSTIGILWSKLMTGEMPWMANPAQVDIPANSVLLAHCTVPRSLVDSYTLRSHFESSSSVGIEGAIPPGPVTLVRIGGIEMTQLWLAEGQIHPREHLEGLCRTQIDVHLSRGSVEDLLSRPLGNHVVVVPGHHADTLHEWWETFIA